MINSIDTTDQDYGVGVIFDYYRRHGFPHYRIREDEKHQHLRKLQRFDIDTIFKDDKIVQTMHCLRLAWTYFPHFWTIQCGGAKYTPMEIFLDVWAEDTLSGEKTKCNEAIYTFVAVSKLGKPVKVPEVIPETELEKIRFDGALRRRQLSLILGGKMKADDATELKALFKK